MIETLQWATLSVCGVAALARIPSAVRGENRSLFYIFILATLAILLSIDGPYVAIDSVLGSTNVTNLILRFVVFAVIFFIGCASSRPSAPKSAAAGWWGCRERWCSDSWLPSCWPSSP